jgi:type I restriction enzyme M protein
VQIGGLVTHYGIELVDSVTGLCAMNLLLHGIGGHSEEDLTVITKDALAGKHGEYEIVLAKPSTLTHNTA